MSVRPILLVAVAACALRLTLLIAYPVLRDDAGMAVVPVEMAASLVEGDGFTVDQGPRAVDSPERAALVVPGQAVVLSALWAVIPGEDGTGGLELLQVFVDVGNVVLIWIIGRRIFDDGAGLAAAGLYAVCVPVALLATQVLDPVWVTASVLGAVALWQRGHHPAVIGLVAGIGAYFRPNTLVAPVLLAVTCLLLGRRREALRLAIVGTGIAYLVFAPWVLRQTVAHDAVLPFGRTGTGQTAWEALGALPNDVGAVLSDDVTFEQVTVERPELAYGSPAYDEFLLDRWKAAVVEEPGLLARVASRTALTALRWPELAYTSVRTGWADTFGRLLAVGAAVGAVVEWSRRRSWLVLAVLVGGWVAMQAPFVCSPRMVLPTIAPAYCLMAGAALSWCWHHRLEVVLARDEQQPPRPAEGEGAAGVVVRAVDCPGRQTGRLS